MNHFLVIQEKSRSSVIHRHTHHNQHLHEDTMSSLLHTHLHTHTHHCRVHYSLFDIILGVFLVLPSLHDALNSPTPAGIIDQRRNSFVAALITISQSVTIICVCIPHDRSCLAVVVEACFDVQMPWERSHTAYYMVLCCVVLCCIVTQQIDGITRVSVSVSVSRQMTLE